MLDLILNPTIILAGLIALAVLLPIGALVAWKTRPALQRRLTIAIGTAGPIVLVLYGVYTGLVATFGADSIWTAMIFFVLCGALGIGLGGWIKGEAAPPREE
ncbi:hypothetical protein KQI84_11465 [bacterium]|nr:hypothetical protein [bacterium]